MSQSLRSAIVNIALSDPNYHNNPDYQTLVRLRDAIEGNWEKVPDFKESCNSTHSIALQDSECNSPEIPGKSSRFCFVGKFNELRQIMLDSGIQLGKSSRFSEE